MRHPATPCKAANPPDEIDKLDAIDEVGSARESKGPRSRPNLSTLSISSTASTASSQPLFESATRGDGYSPRSTRKNRLPSPGGVSTAIETWTALFLAVAVTPRRARFAR